MGVALVSAALFAPLQVYLGDASGREVFRLQPAKLAAMEGLWETNSASGAPFAIVALPDAEKERNEFEVSIPRALSLLVTHTLSGRVTGLKAFPREERPNVPILFASFRLMVAIGFLYLFMMAWAAVLWWRRRLFTQRAFLWTLVVIQALGWVAVEMGWITAEVGRQPWLVYGIMRTSEAVSPVRAGNVVWSLALFVVIFCSIGASYTYYVLRAFWRGPEMASPIPNLQRRAGLKIIDASPEETGR
jgi:cytochrome d ubiquinol oxidase subunit I